MELLWLLGVPASGALVLGFFGAMSATYGMPMVIELGVALDVLVAMLVLGVFFFQIREQFDSLDLHHLESLKESE